MSRTAPLDPTSKTLNALKGWPSPTALDFHAELDADETDPVWPGTVFQLNEDGKFIVGLGTDAVMPLFCFPNIDDPDINMYGGDPATKKNVFIGISPTGQIVALPACGPYELTSTHFVADEDYTPNTPLKSLKTGDDAGKIQPGTLYTDMICGIVSRGIVDNGYGHSAVAFWSFPVFPNP